MFAGAALALLGCKNNLDATKIEGAITDGMKAKEVTPTSVKCPADRALKAGDKFECDAVLPGGTAAKVHVEQKDDQGNITWKLDGAIVNQEKAGHALEAKLAPGTKIMCPSKVVVLKKGDKFDCDFTQGATKAKVDITATDDEGSVESKLQK